MAVQRLLILMNPGRQSRFYLLGIAAAAERLGIPTLRLDLGPIWAHVERARSGGQDSLPVELQSVQRQVAALVRHERVSHVLGYGYNGTGDLGLLSSEQQGRRALVPLFSGLGLRHLMLWTDHPEWLADGAAVAEPLRTVLRHPNHFHFLKSGAAAAEAAAVLGWPNTRAIDMAEDPAIVSPAGLAPLRDAAMVLGEPAEPPPPGARKFLDDPDPDPAAIDAEMLEGALRAWRDALPPGAPEAGDALPRAWLEAKIMRPLDSFWRISRGLGPAHTASLAWLAADPARWYRSLRALRRMVAWRRSFWPAWLARRADLAVLGCDASPIGVRQSPCDARWVDYPDQARAYSLGRAAININAAHDEEGMTHKPFQIAAAGVPCVHHRTRGIEHAFEPGREALFFTRGPELLDAVRQLAADPRRRAAMAEAIRARLLRDHTWHRRLPQMLEAADAAPGSAEAA